MPNGGNTSFTGIPALVWGQNVHLEVMEPVKPANMSCNY